MSPAFFQSPFLGFHVVSAYWDDEGSSFLGFIRFLGFYIRFPSRNGLTGSCERCQRSDGTGRDFAVFLHLWDCDGAGRVVDWAEPMILADVATATPVCDISGISGLPHGMAGWGDGWDDPCSHQKNMANRKR